MAEQLSTRLNNGQRLPMLGLGAWDMYGKEAEQAVAWALEIGYRLVDTASMYDNEAEVGNAIRSSGIARSEIFITTKVGNSDQGYDATLKAFERSLKKIHCDYIDLYLVHWPIRKSRKETWRALEALYREGLVKSIGVANYLIPFLKELESYASVVPAINQVEFSPYLYLKDLQDHCFQKGIHLQAYSPLARGHRMDDPKLLTVAKKYARSPAQIMLRWIIQHGVSAIPKSSDKKRLQQNFEIFDFELKAEDLSYLDTFNENLRVVEDPMDMW